jgi:three-Cys-motif partner protein
MNEFGGDWTKIKIEILVDYAKAFLTIMNKHSGFKTMYFDGFAGSGFIFKDKSYEVDITIGAARRILEIDKPKPFDLYYFVELNQTNYKLLLNNTKDAFPEKIIHVICEDGNKKLIDMANFLSKPENKNFRTLAYIDPCGMQVEWKTIESLKGLPMDIWILVPTGMGVNRLLKKNFQISDEWYSRLEKFLGLSKNEIDSFFYKKSNMPDLFGDNINVNKEVNAIEKSAELYRKRLSEVFEFVSSPFVLKNSTNSIMYHLFHASNNKVASKIANDVVKKYKI